MKCITIVSFLHIYINICGIALKTHWLQMSELSHCYHALGACFNPQTNLHNLHSKSSFHSVWSPSSICPYICFV
jgi:hypothetical protein